MQGRWKPHVFKHAGRWWVVDKWGSLRALGTTRPVFSPSEQPFYHSGVAARLGANRQQQLNLGRG